MYEPWTRAMLWLLTEGEERAGLGGGGKSEKRRINRSTINHREIKYLNKFKKIEDQRSIKKKGKFSSRVLVK